MATPKGDHACGICGEARDYICERCLRCEKCCREHDKTRDKADQHLGGWLWSIQTVKGQQLLSLEATGHAKGDWPGRVSKSTATGAGGKA